MFLADEVNNYDTTIAFECAGMAVSVVVSNVAPHGMGTSLSGNIAAGTHRLRTGRRSWNSFGRYLQGSTKPSEARAGK
jgi:hypothetical protein